MERYVIFNENGEAENIVLWDGESEWTPPEGTTIVPEVELDEPVVIESDIVAPEEEAPMSLIDINALIALIQSNPELFVWNGPIPE